MNKHATETAENLSATVAQVEMVRRECDNEWEDLRAKVNQANLNHSCTNLQSEQHTFRVN